jgi:hypothetical protein
MGGDKRKKGRATSSSHEEWSSHEKLPQGRGKRIDLEDTEHQEHLEPSKTREWLLERTAHLNRLFEDVEKADVAKESDDLIHEGSIMKGSFKTTTSRILGTKESSDKKGYEGPQPFLKSRLILDESKKRPLGTNASRSTTKSEKHREMVDHDLSFSSMTDDIKKEMALEKFSGAIEDLRMKYHLLCELRETEAEKLLRQFSENAQKRFDASDALIDRLREDIKEFQSLSRLNEQNEVILDFYKNLTGLQVTLDSKNNVMFTCSQLGRHGRVNYQLKYDDQEEGFDYTPLSTELVTDESVDGGDGLGYFEEELFFPKNHLRMFFWRFTDFLNK